MTIDKMQEEIENKFGIKLYDTNAILFYYNNMKVGMDSIFDIDRYAALNTLFQYDIGRENAEAINEGFYETNNEIFEINANEESRKLLMDICKAKGVELDFSHFRTEPFECYDYYLSDNEENNLMQKANTTWYEEDVEGALEDIGVDVTLENIKKVLTPEFMRNFKDRIIELGNEMIRQQAEEVFW